MGVPREARAVGRGGITTAMKRKQLRQMSVEYGLRLLKVNGKVCEKVEVSVAIALGLENIEYEPEQFPGLVYRMRDPKVVTLLFSTGKVICTGARNQENVEQALVNLRRVLEEHGFL